MYPFDNTDRKMIVRGFVNTNRENISQLLNFLSQQELFFRVCHKTFCREISYTVSLRQTLTLQSNLCEPLIALFSRLHIPRIAYL
jgi:hypothetical protein